VVGEDDTYPKDRRGRPVEPVKFTIRSEKCPNRRGVEEVLRHFQGSVVPFRDVIEAAKGGHVKAAWVTGGYSTNAGGWLNGDVIGGVRKGGVGRGRGLQPGALGRPRQVRAPGGGVRGEGGAVHHPRGPGRGGQGGAPPAAGVPHRGAGLPRPDGAAGAGAGGS